MYHGFYTVYLMVVIMEHPHSEGHYWPRGGCGVVVILRVR
jgi:hypothetical protein